MKNLSFRNCQVTFATNHGKAEAAREPFARILNATVIELPIESDRLGTFSGEVERAGSMVDALRGKIALARTLTEARFVLASEGSFGPAGGFGCAAQGIEMLMLHDGESGAEILEQYVSLDTNYALSRVKTREDLTRFRDRITFGSHALVLYPEGPPSAGNIHKGIVDSAEAEAIFDRCLAVSPSGEVWAMSDMRAHCNPTRMRCIAACCELLAHRLASQCPRCGCGGFGLVATVPGLPCASCGCPTHRARAERHGCSFCGASIERARSDGEQYADPGYCDSCNP